MSRLALCLLLALPVASTAVEPLPDLARALEALRAVGREGEGNGAAAPAWREVARRSPSSLPEILGALDGAGELAANWIRSAVDAVCERELRRGGSLPGAELEAFILDAGNDPRARSLAYEWLLRFDASLPERIIPRIGDDPSVELRREAVSRALATAKGLLEAEDRGGAAREYRSALRLARDDDQVREAAKRLRELGEAVDLQRHFGFVSRWFLVGPFDNRGSTGFDKVYPPELRADPDAAYAGLSGEVRWKEHTTEDDYGMVDLNKALGRHKGAVAYALAGFESGSARDLDIRIGCVTAWKLWVNGELLFGHEEYHHGMSFDQFRVKARLQEGANSILLKVCQNEQTEEWAQEWRFQLRVCDAAGTAVPPASPRTGGESPEGERGEP